jgi:hypothetical protein
MFKSLFSLLSRKITTINHANRITTIPTIGIIHAINDRIMTVLQPIKKKLYLFLDYDLFFFILAI